MDSSKVAKILATYYFASPILWTYGFPQIKPDEIFNYATPEEWDVILNQFGELISYIYKPTNEDYEKPDPFTTYSSYLILQILSKLPTNTQGKQMSTIFQIQTGGGNRNQNVSFADVVQNILNSPNLQSGGIPIPMKKFATAVKSAFRRDKTPKVDAKKVNVANATTTTSTNINTITNTTTTKNTNKNVQKVVVQTQGPVALQNIQRNAPTTVTLTQQISARNYKQNLTARITALNMESLRENQMTQEYMGQQILKIRKELAKDVEQMKEWVKNTTISTSEFSENAKKIIVILETARERIRFGFPELRGKKELKRNLGRKIIRDLIAVSSVAIGIYAGIHSDNYTVNDSIILNATEAGEIVGNQLNEGSWWNQGISFLQSTGSAISELPGMIAKAPSKIAEGTGKMVTEMTVSAIMGSVKGAIGSVIPENVMENFGEYANKAGIGSVVAMTAIYFGNNAYAYYNAKTDIDELEKSQKEILETLQKECMEAIISDYETSIITNLHAFQELLRYSPYRIKLEEYLKIKGGWDGYHRYMNDDWNERIKRVKDSGYNQLIGNETLSAIHKKLETLANKHGEELERIEKEFRERYITTGNIASTSVKISKRAISFTAPLIIGVIGSVATMGASILPGAVGAAGAAAVHGVKALTSGTQIVVNSIGAATGSRNLQGLKEDPRLAMYNRQTRLLLQNSTLTPSNLPILVQERSSQRNALVKKIKYEKEKELIGKYRAVLPPSVGKQLTSIRQITNIGQLGYKNDDAISLVNENENENYKLEEGEIRQFGGKKSNQRGRQTRRRRQTKSRRRQTRHRR
jgi:hypothetical protein